MAKNGIYVFVLLLLLTPFFDFASASDCDVEDSSHPGYWSYMSLEFHGACVAWRKEPIIIALVSMMNK
ncbi:hypothetical protein SUGI_0492140 [Cryptomeria japonica]|nr:hypothetical protein SUGI_0492010 [Cryptomeria japonica]GLJ25685.1 hypothetical protein SUGI_0492050 [Cryptomeria japonica]GLJ25688.1 hypothetical protein SUGI_0492080 [Cryptomeria japonica]GLJ25691.1 hypothetical protein SUGI_0492120 [Cryptomeria japonica]GLJ25693.1 hypothetical protein SUGI_0492140 [Cryptomeria japonica]